MNKSENISELAAALAKAQPEFGSAVKDAKNTFLNSNYADLTSVWSAVKNILPDHGLAVSQLFEPMPGEECVCVETVLIHESGQWISGKIIIPFTKDAKNLAQAAGSAATYARRYGLAAILGIVTDDDDGHGAGRNDDRPANKNANRGNTGNRGKTAAAESMRNEQAAKREATPKPESTAKPKGDKWKGTIAKRETEIREMLRTLYKIGDEPLPDKVWNPETFEEFVQDRFDKAAATLDADEVEVLVGELQGRIDDAEERAAIQFENEDQPPSDKMAGGNDPEPMITPAQIKSINRLCDIKDREPAQICKDVTDGKTSKLEMLTEHEAEQAIKMLNAIKK